jgi:hypothetical protein
MRTNSFGGAAQKYVRLRPSSKKDNICYPMDFLHQKSVGGHRICIGIVEGREGLERARGWWASFEQEVTSNPSVDPTDEQ